MGGETHCCALTLCHSWHTNKAPPCALCLPGVGPSGWVWGADEGISSGLGGEAAVKLNGLMRVKSWHRSQVLMALCLTALGNCQDLCFEELFSFLVVDNL